MAERAFIRDVTLRDGIQLTRDFMPTERKVVFCEALAAIGYKEAEVTSFVPPAVIPQFADATEVLGQVLDMDRLHVSVLVPNLKGAELALRSRAPQINFVISASEAHNQANVRKSTGASLDDFRAIVRLIREYRSPGSIRVTAGIATAFGCSIQGHVPEDRVVELAAELKDAGADELLIADTVGYGNPAQVRRVVGKIMAVIGTMPVIAHFHDTRGLGLANLVASLDVGVRQFDASVGGLGGCPFAPGATGNIDAEDCIFMLESMGFDTGIDLDALAALRERLKAWLPAERYSGHVAQAGLPKTFGP